MAKQGTSRGPNQPYHRPKHRHPHWGLRILGLAVILFGLSLLVPQLADQVNQYNAQKSLQPFYETPANIQAAKPGQVLRREPMDIDVPGGGQAIRVLYRSERGDGSPTVSSGMVFFPATASDVKDRPVVAWAHGTVGFGDQCAPSRSVDPTADMAWLGQMLKRGWVVAATDYAGIGTEGISRYLIGDDEARDVLNSVRAARELDPKAGIRYALWGHSQGGHSVLWSASESKVYAPELDLVATAAGAPAAELPQLFTEQYQSAASWVIGPDAAVAWPSAYPHLALEEAISNRGLRTSKEIAMECATQSAEGGLIRSDLGQEFFKVNPMSLPSWQLAAREQTPEPLPPNRPLLIVQSLTDKVVLPNTTAAYIEQSCTVGSDIETMWLNDIAHQDTANVAGPSVVDWLGSRFESKPTASSCGQPLPVALAK